MCAECDRLRQENADLRRLVGESVTATESGVLRQRFRLSRNEAWLLLALYQAGGRVMSKEAIITNMPSRLDDALDRDTAQVSTVICKLRARTDKAWIASVWGDGYRMTDAGRAGVAEALQLS